MASDTLGPAKRLSKEHRAIERAIWLLSSVRRNAEGGDLTRNQQVQIDKSTSVIGAALLRMLDAEEAALFPVLAAVPALKAQVKRLEAQHGAVRALVGQVAPRFRAWLRDGSITAAENAALARDLGALQALLFEHLRAEEQTLFPHADHHLSPDDVAGLVRILDGRPQEDAR